ncbi:MAG: TonB-dependent receptor [Candidatus Aminicenantes bacterium]|nr:TonB-dependent receptor [Candidatus Aminicenantes bacterium]
MLIVALEAAIGGSGILNGVVLDPAGNPVAGAEIVLSSDDALHDIKTQTTADGSFAIAGISPREYTISVHRAGFARLSYPGIVFEPDQARFVRLILEPSETPPLPASRNPLWVDLTDVTARTVIDEFQARALPSANNVWSLIEGQDFSATTNRIDVGGLWASLPALWSSRGSMSWTQSSYLINGMDATDPYDTGTPLYYPDVEAFRFVVHDNGRFPIRHSSPGGTFDFIPKEGTNEYHGAVSAFLTAPGMSSGRIPARLEDEGILERTKLVFFGNASARFSGPIVPGKLFFFASLSHLDLRRDIAEFSPEDKGTVSSALLNLSYPLDRGSLHLFWTGQIVRHPTAGAGRDVPLSATVDQKNTFNIFQLIWRFRLRPNHHFEIGAAFNQGNSRSAFQNGSDEPHGEEVFERIPSGAAAMADEEDRSTVVFQGKGQALLGDRRFAHRIDYGFSLRGAASSTGTEILDNIHIHYFGDAPFEIVRFNTPLRHRERAFHTHLFAEDTITLRSLASFSFGLHLISTRGWVPATESTTTPGFPERASGGKINWMHLSPRLGFSVPFLQDRSLTLRVSAGRYFFNLPLSDLTAGNPQGLGGLAYPWTDQNGDGRIQSDETGTLWRREGPAFTEIDPDLKRPYTDEFAVSFTKIFRHDLYLTLAGFYRETRHLVETLNTGVPLTAYDPFEIYDPGDNRIVGDHDDLYLTVFNQKKDTLGRDFFLLTNPDTESRVNRYRGLDLILVKKFSRNTVLFFAGTATEAVGTASPGNSEYENDDGVIGALYDNPNASIFAKGRLRFDRAYTARLGLSLPLPCGFRLSGLAKYYDGQPFSRKIIITGFTQGPFYVHAFSRGVARYEFNMTVDLRIEKSLSLGKAQARIFFDIYNIFNWALATQENEWTGDDFLLRYATEIQSPRVARLGVRYEF